MKYKGLNITFKEWDKIDYLILRIGNNLLCYFGKHLNRSVRSRLLHTALKEIKG